MRTRATTPHDTTRTPAPRTSRTGPPWPRRGLQRLLGAAAVVALVLAQSAVGTAYAVAPTLAPALVGPLDAAQISSNPVLTWTPVLGAVKYRVQVSTGSGFTNVTGSNGWSADVPVTTAAPPLELPNAVLYWRVAATDGSSTNVGPWSQVRTFRKTLAPAPHIVGPVSDTTFVYPTQTPILRWDPLPGAQSYNVEIDDEDAFINPQSVGTASTAYVVTSSLTLDKRYYWKVSGVTPDGNATADSETRSFFVSWPENAGNAAVDGKPDLTGPDDTTVTPVNDVVLTWDPVLGAKNYLLDVGRTPDFANTLVEAETVVVGTQYSPPTEYTNGEYYWKLRAVDSFGRKGPWSATRMFRRAAPEPSVPTLLTPADSASVSEWGFTWTAVPGAGAYELEYATDIGLSVHPVLCSTFHTSITGYSRTFGAAPVYPGQGSACQQPTSGAYYWHVRAIDTSPGSTWGQTGAWSSVRQVILTVPAYSSTPVSPEPVVGYLAPADCEAPACTDLLPDTPRLSWAAVAGASWYRVHLATMPTFSTETAIYSVAGTHLTPRESLPDNATNGAYYWWVQPCNGTIDSPLSCAALSPGDARAFRKLATSVVLATPDDGATVTDVVPMSWVDPFGLHPTATGVGAYRVQISDGPTFVNIKATALVDETSYEAIATMLPDGVYYWRVQVVDGSELDLTPSEYRTFTKTSSKPANLVATTVEGTTLPVLSWDPQSFLSLYIVEIYSGTDPNFPVSAKTIFGTTSDRLPAFTPTAAMPAGDYSWRVRRVDSGGTPNGNPGPWTVTDSNGDLPTFTVVAPSPTLVSPADTITVVPNDLVFTWDAVPGAAEYKFESSTSSVFASVLESQFTVMTTWAPMVTTYPNGVPVYWRVKAIDGAGNILSTSLVRSVVRDGAGPVGTVTTTGADSTLRPSVRVDFNEVAHGVSPTSVLVRSALGATLPTVAVCADVAAAVVSCAGDGVRSVALTATTNAVPGETYSVVVTTVVVDGMSNPANASVATFRALRSVEQNAGSATWSSGWATVKSAVASGGSYARQGAKGASMSWTFKGTSMKFGYVTARTNGKALIYVDGKLRTTLDLYGSTAAKRTYSATGLTNARHVLRVVVAGLRSTSATGAYVTVDLLSTS